MSATNRPDGVYVAESPGSQHDFQESEQERTDKKDLETGRKDEPDAALDPPVATEERYSMWSYHEKLLIITLTGFAAMLSCVQTAAYRTMRC